MILRDKLSFDQINVVGTFNITKLIKVTYYIHWLTANTADESDPGKPGKQRKEEINSTVEINRIQSKLSIQLVRIEQIRKAIHVAVVFITIQNSTSC